MDKFKIFYSWQSDLPGNKTRSFIRECIDEAIDLAKESETIEAERDEATTGVTGSPDIVATLFSKIDDCDLFVADLSLCFTETQNKKKRSPNPNVLIELGYAVKTLGWDRIVCLCNTDFGEEYPFDIAHNRITDFSFDGKSRKEVLADISRIIFVNIRDIRNLPPRAKSGLASYMLGAYSYNQKRVIDTLIPIDITKQEGFVLHNEELLAESKQLFDEITRLNENIELPDENSAPEKIVDAAEAMYEQAMEKLDYVGRFTAKETPVVWKDDKIEETIALINQWLGFDVDKNYFFFGGLKRTVNLLDRQSSLLGTDEEIAKYEKLESLHYNLSRLSLRTDYIKTYQEMLFIPIAIQNVSLVNDESIHIVINVNKGVIVEPNEHLIIDEYEGIQGTLCRDDDAEDDVGIICELFALEEDGNIHIEEEPYDPSSYNPKIPKLNGYGLLTAEKDEKDYKEELEEFIASTNGAGYYEFDISNLRPNECKWLSRGLLIKPVDNEIEIQYHIHSSHSNGEINSVLSLKC